MQNIEPFFHWRIFYTAEEDENSPFFGREYNEFEYTDHIYDHYIHPQWDSIESETLFVKVIFADYEEGYSFIELIGEWNDAINNDIRILKENLLELLIDQGINKFILIGEQVVNFHFSDDCYYEELSEDLEDGFIVGINFMNHVVQEFEDNFESGWNLPIHFVDDLVPWRTKTPKGALNLIKNNINLKIEF